MPIKFEIFRDGLRQTNYQPVSAMVMGPESVPVPGDVEIKDGLICINREDDQAAGLSLLWDAGPAGMFQLETTRLPPREKLYNLNVELARARLMKIMQKLEDWNLFDFPRIERHTQRFREAQALFADALGRQDDPGTAATTADQALVMAMDLSEQLTTFHGELLINRRRSAASFVKHIFGCRADVSVQNQKYRDTLMGNFDYAVLPMSWKQMEPQEGEFTTTEMDPWVEALVQKKCPIIAGPLVSLNTVDTPDWLFVWEHDFEALREMAYEYVQKVVHRYRKAVAVWNVAAGLHTNMGFNLSFEQIIELTRLLVSQIKNMLPNARVIITISHPFGEYHANGKPSVPPMLYAEMVASAGINFEAFGVELELGIPAPGQYLRDLFQVSCLLDRFSSLGRPLFLTATACPGRPGVDAGDISGGRFDPSAGGRWRRPWDPRLQAEWMEAVYRTALSKPFVESIAWGNLADIHPSLPSGGLMTDLLVPKPAFDRLQQMREKFHQWSKR